MIQANPKPYEELIDNLWMILRTPRSETSDEACLYQIWVLLKEYEEAAYES